MSLHINRFIDAIKAAESRGQKDFTMSMRDARDLHGDITKLLLAVRILQENTVRASESVQLEVTGGSFKST
jgi:hypothetical protein